ncbi:MAG: hypothetical protein ACYC3X_24005 [Pirellulaceae bacterium]
MAHDFSKLLLERAEGFVQRQKAIRVAMRLGMPLCEIEQHLDRIDHQREREEQRRNHRAPGSPAANRDRRDRYEQHGP